jgi:hypothetical protein
MLYARKTAKKGNKQRFLILMRFLKIEYGRESAADFIEGAKYLGTRENNIFEFFRSKVEFGGFFY